MLKLKLRGRIVGAAAVVFVAAIAASVAYVVYSNQQHDLASADQLLTGVGETEAQTIRLVIKEHATEAAAMAETLSTMIADPAIGQRHAESVRRNHALLESIARESREQASAIAEVNVAVRQMDEMTQHNAALVEETNAAIEQTEAQAVELDNVVDVFRTAGNERAPARPAAAAPARRAPTAKAAARTYLAQGNAAVQADWSEFWSPAVGTPLPLAGGGPAAGWWRGRPQPPGVRPPPSVTLSRATL